MRLDACPLWRCVETHGVEHCGNYSECLSRYDPGSGIVTSLRRAGLLALRRRIGDEAWVRWVKKKKIEFGV